MPLRYLHTLVPVVGIEGWISGILKFISPGSGSLWVPEMSVLEEAGAVGFVGKVVSYGLNPDSIIFCVDLGKLLNLSQH